MYFGLDSICPTRSDIFFAEMKGCEQLWLANVESADYQWEKHFDRKGNG